MIIVGNFVALIAMIIMVLNGVVKDRKKVIGIQAIQNTVATVANFCLKATSGGISTGIGLIRNALIYFDKMNRTVLWILTILSITITVAFNQSGLFGLLPLFSTVPYGLLMDRCNNTQLKMLTIVTLIPWIIYDFGVYNIVAGIFDCLTLCTTAIGLYRIHKDKKRTFESLV